MQGEQHPPVVENNMTDDADRNRPWWQRPGAVITGVSVAALGALGLLVHEANSLSDKVAAHQADATGDCVPGFTSPSCPTVTTAPGTTTEAAPTTTPPATTTTASPTLTPTPTPDSSYSTESPAPIPQGSTQTTGTTAETTNTSSGSTAPVPTPPPSPTRPAPAPQPQPPTPQTQFAINCAPDPAACAPGGAPVYDAPFRGAYALDANSGGDASTGVRLPDGHNVTPLCQGTVNGVHWLIVQTDASWAEPQNSGYGNPYSGYVEASIVPGAVSAVGACGTLDYSGNF